jgi:phenylacetate-CoA ligase
MDVSQRIVRHVFYPLSLWRAGELAERRYRREYEATQFLPAAALRALQLARLRALLEHAVARCPLYRERFAALGLRPGDIQSRDDLRCIPILEKHDIQQQRDRLVAEGWPTNDLIANQTGGSTGRPISFFLCRARKCSRAAATLRHNRWAGWEVGDKVALLWGAPRDAAIGWRARLRRRLLERTLYLDVAHVTENKLAAFHETLKRYRPRVLLAYAQAAVLFARYLHARGLTPYRPHALVTSAEVLEPAQRALLQEVFGTPVFNRYGCREVSVIASECPAHAGLHVMAEGLLVEVVRGERPAAAGEVGSILVTDLLNEAMPLIRYRIGDVGTWEAGDCPCGRGLPRLRYVAGRVTDFLVGTDGRLVSGVFLATYVVAHRPGLGQVQIYQDRAGQVHYRVRARAPAHRDLRTLIEDTRRFLGPGARVSWERVDDLAPEPSGKFLFCRSSVTPDFLDAPPREAAA